MKHTSEPKPTPAQLTPAPKPETDSVVKKPHTPDTPEQGGRPTTPLVFTTRKGTPFEPRNALRSFHALLKVVGLPHHRLHDLRHTAASLLIYQGADLHEVKETLGHSQITLTSDLYGHMYDAAKQRTADRMDDAMAPRTPVAPLVAPLSISAKPN